MFLHSQITCRERETPKVILSILTDCCPHPNISFRSSSQLLCCLQQSTWWLVLIVQGISATHLGACLQLTELTGSIDQESPTCQAVLEYVVEEGKTIGQHDVGLPFPNQPSFVVIGDYLYYSSQAAVRAIIFGHLRTTCSSSENLSGHPGRMQKLDFVLGEGDIVDSSFLVRIPAFQVVHELTGCNCCEAFSLVLLYVLDDRGLGHRLMKQIGIMNQ